MWQTHTGNWWSPQGGVDCASRRAGPELARTVFILTQEGLSFLDAIEPTISSFPNPEAGFLGV